MSDSVNACPTAAGSGPVAAGWAVFATAVGHCGLAWGPRGLRCVRLPEADGSAERMRWRLAREFAQLPECEAAAWPAEVLAAVQGVQALLAGEPRDLREIVLDPSGLSDFQQRLYATARAIGPGQVRTYGDIAEELGDKTLARAVGRALGANPFAPVVPCHRVMGARGWQGGFSAPGGVALKLRMLAIEGAQPGGQAQLF